MALEVAAIHLHHWPHRLCAWRSGSWQIFPAFVTFLLVAFDTVICWISCSPSTIQALSIPLVYSMILVANLPDISQTICHQLISNRNIIRLSLYRCLLSVAFAANVVPLSLSIFLLMASVFKYDSHASCITLYPLACIQKGTDLLDVISLFDHTNSAVKTSTTWKPQIGHAAFVTSP
jgi:hypothetical protein